MRRIVTFGLCVLALPMLAAAQTKDDFAYWDANNNGDLTCSEASGSGAEDLLAQLAWSDVPVERHPAGPCVRGPARP